MPVFVWEGRVGNEIQKGELEAPNKSAVLARLRQMRIQPIPNKIKQKGSLFSIDLDLSSISQREIVIFTRQLST
ncbi:MAG: type II secretion system F family protein, partial [Thermodesulfobacteriota bacterium]